jgi:hypothetical protein
VVGGAGGIEQDEGAGEDRAADVGAGRAGEEDEEDDAAHGGDGGDGVEDAAQERTG